MWVGVGGALSEAPFCSGRQRGAAAEHRQGIQFEGSWVRPTFENNGGCLLSAEEARFSETLGNLTMGMQITRREGPAGPLHKYQGAGRVGGSQGV